MNKVQDVGVSAGEEMKRGEGPNLAPNLPAPVVVAIDPGLANVGVVVMQGGGFVDASTFTTQGDGTPDFPSVMERGQRVASFVVDVLDGLWNVEAVVIESYEDFGGGHLRNRGGKPVPLRWTTPAVCALIGSRVAALGYTVVWQRPSVVMARYRAYKERWRQRHFGIVPGDTRLTNDHVRSAACHALAYLDGKRVG